MELIDRQRYIEEITNWLGKNLAIVLTGQRRVGKSCILRLLCDKLSREGNVIFIDKEQWVEGKHNYIMIDEVQDIAEFERTLRSFYNEPNTDVIVTGSNAKMLSSELATLIGGRYVEIYVQPLSFTEFLQYHKLDINHPDALNYYIEYGVMPGLVQVGLD